MNIKIQQIKTTFCPIEGWKETDNCLQCKFFGGFNISPGNEHVINLSLICNNQ